MVAYFFNWSVLAPRWWFETHRPAAPLIFFPQWYGLIDDAGGFIFSPSGAPEGMNMAGMICDRPVDLGEGWWMCGMRPGQ